MKQRSSSSELSRPVSGMTLIELMVVIAILATVALFVIPTLRTVSRERGLREASRTVAAVFQEAISRARSEGFAGVLIARNPNVFRVVDAAGNVPSLDRSGLVATGTRVYYAGQTMYQMRQPLPYEGNEDGEVTLPPTPPLPGPGFFDFLINEPLDKRVVIENGSFVTFGKSPVKFEIVLVNRVLPVVVGDPVRLRLRCRLGSLAPEPVGMASGLSFRIWRRPEAILSSAVSVPRGHLINFNYSGTADPRAPTLPVQDLFDTNDLTWTDFSQALLPIDRPLIDPEYAVKNLANPVANPRYFDVNLQPLVILFDQNGRIDRIFPYGMYADSWVSFCKAGTLQGYVPPPLNGPTFPTAYLPATPLKLCITTDDFENTFLQTPGPGYEMPLSVNRAQRDVLSTNDVQWVTVDQFAGRVNVSETVQNTAVFPDPGAGNRSLAQVRRIMNARGFAASPAVTKD